MDLTVQDRVKRAYQRAFGGGHMISDARASLQRLAAECAALETASPGEPLFEPLGGGQCRMHLRPLLATGLSLETANAMFVYSANHAARDEAGFEAALRAMEREGGDARAWIADYRAKGCPAIGHSEAYRARHRPAYRVVWEGFARAFALVLRMDALRGGLVAIDGPCASGKTTLAAALGGVFGAGVLHMDDFFLRPQQRTPERLAEPGGNVDRERFAKEVLGPLRAGGDFAFRPFDCGVQALAEPVAFKRTPLVIVEGAYALHPELRGAYDIKAFVSVDPARQHERIRARNGKAMLARFEREWIPMENAYFEAFAVREACDFVIE